MSWGANERHFGSAAGQAAIQLYQCLDAEMLLLGFRVAGIALDPGASASEIISVTAVPAGYQRPGLARSFG